MKEERRDNRRAHIALPIVYTLLGPRKSRHLSSTGAGTIFNVSNDGLGFYTYMPIDGGAEVELISREMWESPKFGKVVWCRTIHHNHFRVGISLH